jgi:hypothetical protein
MKTRTELNSARNWDVGFKKQNKISIPKWPMLSPLEHCSDLQTRTNKVIQLYGRLQAQNVV